MPVHTAPGWNRLVQGEKLIMLEQIIVNTFHFVRNSNKANKLTE